MAMVLICRAGPRLRPSTLRASSTHGRRAASVTYAAVSTTSSILTVRKRSERLSLATQRLQSNRLTTDLLQRFAGFCAECDATSLLPPALVTINRTSASHFSSCAGKLDAVANRDGSGCRASVHRPKRFLSQTIWLSLPGRKGHSDVSSGSPHSVTAPKQAEAIAEGSEETALADPCGASVAVKHV
ncbi:hypothetical protein HPB51_004081 [Rhipicephalus microplus]|uniref:Uncharacterized protein n=1 Tax=Rhipicephalus microplus TaxID=6941 RepID=A0A9J6D3X1_RHIMP|nr:hypothetical protein HPB51_004081 [Rhipicephalus microplus]